MIRKKHKLINLLICSVSMLFSFNAQSQDEELRFFLNYEAYGLAPYPQQSTGARVGVETSDFEFELSSIYYSSEILLTKYSFLEREFRVNYITEEQFRWSIGLGQREIKLDYSVFSVDTDTNGQEEIENISTHEHHQAYTVNGHFGFHKDLNSYIGFGTDILSISIPFNWQSNSGSFLDNAAAFESDPKDIPFIKTLFSTNLQILRTYIRVSL